jgi:hypothetical protein
MVLMPGQRPYCVSFILSGMFIGVLRIVGFDGEVLLEVDARGKGSTVASSYKLGPIFSQPLPNKPSALWEMVSEVDVGVISNLGYLRW